ncbi:MAG: hypothetical protein LWY06_18005 [Firmicutes bacterium]|nr:hypothetical protein [Bacillota bacterium]
MQLSQFRDFTRRLSENLNNHPHILGFVAVGSMAEDGRLPDKWSDHDFFVITEEGMQDRYRQNTDWIPDNEKIVFSFQETEHGVKVIYDTGHLLEFAVFSPDELFLARINSCSLLIDKADIRERVDRVIGETNRWSASNVAGSRYLAGQFLTNLLVGAGRHFRGEKISGFEFAKVHGLNHFIKLTAKHIQPDDPEALDNISPLRRFEQAYTTIGERINHLLTLETPAYCLGMLEIFSEHFSGNTDFYPGLLVQAVRNTIEKELKNE